MKVNRKEFLNTLKLVQPGLDTKSNMAPNFIFTDGRVFAFNDEIATSHPIDADFEGGIPAGKLYDFIDKVKTDEIELTLKGDELSIKAGRANVGLRVDGDITIPIEEMEIPEEFNELPDNFCEAIDFCLLSITKERSKTVLSCLHINESLVESCDNHRLTRFDLSSEINDRFLLPAEVAKDIIKCKPIEYALSTGWIHFRNENDVWYSCRIYDEDYLDLDTFLKVKGTTVEFPNGLGDILERANTISEENRSLVVVDDGMLTIKSEGDVGWFKEQSRIKYKGEPFEFAIHPMFLKEILNCNRSAVISDKLMKFSGENFVHVVRLLAIKKDSK